MGCRLSRMGMDRGQRRTSASADRAARRYNPDTIDTPVWIFRNTWIPVPVFKDISRPRVDETEVWFVHVRERYHVRVVPEEMRAEYSTAPPAAFEHPREMAAYLLSDPATHTASPGFNRLIGLVGATSLPLHKSPLI